MSQLFVTVLKMSLTASLAALVVISVRLLLTRAPKVYSYALWSVVLFRLLSPFSFASRLSLIRPITNVAPQNSVFSPAGSGVSVTGNVVQNTIALASASPVTNVNPAGTVINIASVIWLMGVFLLLFYSVISYLKLKKRLAFATRVKDHIFESDLIQSPFVLGFVKPRIYVPTGLPAGELAHILMHEEIHIKRRDYLIKSLAFFAVVLHWFNPLIWFCYFLMTKDMEMSCDESVMKHSTNDIRTNYSDSLLSLSRKQSGLFSPLAFGESNVKSRIKNVLNYKKPTFWLAAVAFFTVLVVTIGLTTNPLQRGVPLTELDGVISPHVLDTSQRVVIKAIDTGAEINVTDQDMINGVIIKFIKEIRCARKEISQNRSGTRDEKYQFYLYSGSAIDPFIININNDFTSVWVNNSVKPSFSYPITNTSQVKEEFKAIEQILALVSQNESDSGGVAGPAGIFGSTPDATYELYKKAMLERDYHTIAKLSGEEPQPYGQQIWDTIHISEVKLVKKDVRGKKACYTLELTVDDPGTSAFEKGLSPRWMYLVKNESGWYVEGLMTGGEPQDDWWYESR